MLGGGVSCFPITPCPTLTGLVCCLHTPLPPPLPDWRAPGQGPSCLALSLSTLDRAWPSVALFPSFPSSLCNPSPPNS